MGSERKGRAVPGAALDGGRPHEPRLASPPEVATRHARATRLESACSFPRAERPEDSDQSTSAPQPPQLSDRAAPRPSSPGLGPADALLAQRGESVQHSGGKGDGVAQQRGQGQADDDGNDGHPGGEAEVKGARPPRGRHAASGLPRQPGAGSIPRDQLGQMHDRALPRPPTPINLLAKFREEDPKLSSDF